MDYSKLVSDAVSELCTGSPSKDVVAKHIKRAFEAGWDAGIEQIAAQPGMSNNTIVDVGGVNVAQNLSTFIRSFKKRHS